jgi:hypothetical protein
LRSISHLNGLEFLKVHKPQLWKQIVQVVEGIDAKACRTKISREARSMNKVLYSAPAMNKAMKTAFEKHGWRQQRTSYWVTADAQLIRKTITLPANEQRQEIRPIIKPIS